MVEQVRNPLVKGHYTVRPVTLEDVDAVLALVHVLEEETLGERTMTAKMLLREWQSPDFDMASSTRGVFTPEGQAVGYAEVGHPKEKPVRPWIYVGVHPDHRADDMGDVLLEWAESTAMRVLDMVPPEAAVTLVTDTVATDTYYIDRLKQAGFIAKNQSWQKMLIEMDKMPPEPTLPDGITITTQAVYNDLQAVFEASRTSFRDHRGYTERDPEESFQRWLYWHTSDEETFDPSLWFLAVEGDTIAGVSLCRLHAEDAPDEGYIDTLGVVPAYRRRGLAQALLVHTFRELYARGQRKASLHVDGSSLTGANKLYTRAGMHVDKEYNVFEKRIRDGVELSRQE